MRLEAGQLFLYAAIASHYTAICYFDWCMRAPLARVYSGCWGERGIESVNGTAAGQKHDLKFWALPRKPRAWRTADEWCMLWWMSGGQREPTERSIVLRWPVKNSIIPRSHLWLTPLFPTCAASQRWKSNNIIVAGPTADSITAQCRNMSRCNFLAKVCKHFRCNVGLWFDDAWVNNSPFYLSTK